MIEDIKKNIDSEIEILREISIHSRQIDFASSSEQKLLLATISSLIASFRIINNSIPALLDDIMLVKEPSRKMEMKKNELEEVIYSGKENMFRATIPAKNKELLLKELSIGESNLRKIRRKRKDSGEHYSEFKAARGYVKLANKLFLRKATEFSNKGYFKKLSKEIRKANIEMLFQTYVAMIFLSVLFAFIISFILAIFLFLFNIGLNAPFIGIYSGDYLTRFFHVIWMPLVVPIVVFVLLYFYPSTEKNSLSKKINQELPFAVIHMNAISGSGIQPSEIFRIIGLSKEYPALRKEIRKVLNQINLYGYDLITALNNTSNTTSSEKLAELFSGLATTITSGGSFSGFFEKRAETLLMDYRLERQKYSKTAETFMDIYISVVIAAPMILMLFLIMLTVGNFDIGLSVNQLTFLIITITTLINVLFLMFIHINQPNY